jgi:hypothetical protein
MDMLTFSVEVMNGDTVMAETAAALDAHCAAEGHPHIAVADSAWHAEVTRAVVCMCHASRFHLLAAVFGRGLKYGIKPP